MFLNKKTEDHNAVSKQPKMKMMLTVKAYLEVMVLYLIGRKWIWCQQKSSGIEEKCWHQGRILLRWYSVFLKPPSHHHEKTSKRYSIGMSLALWLPVGQKFESSSWAGVGPKCRSIHWFHGVGEWGAASNSAGSPMRQGRGVNYQVSKRKACNAQAKDG